MIPSTYADRIRQIVDHLETTQIDAVNTAADYVVHAFRNRGAVYCWRLGHGIEGDSIHRAGGLVGVKHFNFNIHVHAELPACLTDERAPANDADLERVRFAVASSSLRGGDVMLLASVSGKNREPIELALACRKAGVRVVSFSSIAYTSEVESLHPTGKKLCEASDINIDIGAPYGDAAVDIPGIDVPVLPVSGAAMATAAWMIWGRVMEVMAADGDPPSVLMSVNRDGGPDYNKTSKQRFSERGY